MENDKFDIVLAGSVITRGEARFIHPYIEQAVKACAPKASLVKLQVEPVVGALWLAFEAEGNSLPQEVYERLRTVSDYNLV